MAITSASFTFPAEVLAETIQTGFEGRKALLDTGAAIVSSTLPGDARPSNTVRVPYFGVVGEFEDVAEGEALTPASLTPASETATVLRTGKLIESTEWGLMLAQKDDPIQRFADQLVEGAFRRFDQALIDVARASLPSMTVTATSQNLDYDLVVDAQAKFEDEADESDFACLAMHPKVFFDLRKLKDSTGRPLGVETVNDDGKRLRMFAGFPVITSRRLTASAGVYTTLLIRKGALALWYNEVPFIDFDKDIARHTEKMACNIHYACHRYSKMPGGTLPGVAIIKHK